MWKNGFSCRHHASPPIRLAFLPRGFIVDFRNVFQKLFLDSRPFLRRWFDFFSIGHASKLDDFQINVNRLIDGAPILFIYFDLALNLKFNTPPVSRLDYVICFDTTIRRLDLVDSNESPSLFQKEL